MPWRPVAPNLSSNYPQVLIRLEQVKRKFEKNARFRQQYTEVLDGYICKGHARKVKSIDSNVQFFLSHGVFHPQEPNKLRVVFDCAAKFHGRSLNDELLSGPDLMNNLVGVLFRFRVGKVAFACDIESMFHQIRMPISDQRFLGFLWWTKGDVSLKPEVYCMTVRLFGAKSSPSCASFALLQTAEDNSNEFDDLTIGTVRRNFCTDDCLKAVHSVEEATRLVKQLLKLLDRGGSRPGKWLTTHDTVLESVSEPSSVQSNASFVLNDKTTYHVLGVTWDEIGRAHV